jgi:hypothetical protein
MLLLLTTSLICRCFLTSGCRCNANYTLDATAGPLTASCKLSASPTANPVWVTSGSCVMGEWTVTQESGMVIKVCVIVRECAQPPLSSSFKPFPSFANSTSTSCALRELLISVLSHPCTRRLHPAASCQWHHFRLRTASGKRQQLHSRMSGRLQAGSSGPATSNLQSWKLDSTRQLRGNPLPHHGPRCYICHRRNVNGSWVLWHLQQQGG